jgi:hypothetical protein
MQRLERRASDLPVRGRPHRWQFRARGDLFAKLAAWAVGIPRVGSPRCTGKAYFTP